MFYLYEQFWYKFLKENVEKHPHYNDGKSLTREHYKKTDKQKTWHPEKFEKKLLGNVGQFEVWLVDDNAIRDLIDTDWTSAGNPARDIYQPDNHIWLSQTAKKEDIPPFIIHEITEYHAMLDDEMSYEDAHVNVANENEREIRDRRLNNKWSIEDDPIEVSIKFLKEQGYL